MNDGGLSGTYLKLSPTSWTERKQTIGQDMFSFAPFPLFSEVMRDWFCLVTIFSSRKRKEKKRIGGFLQVYIPALPNVWISQSDGPLLRRTPLINSATNNRYPIESQRIETLRLELRVNYPDLPSDNAAQLSPLATSLINPETNRLSAPDRRRQSLSVMRTPRDVSARI